MLSVVVVGKPQLASNIPIDDNKKEKISGGKATFKYLQKSWISMSSVEKKKRKQEVYFSRDYTCEFDELFAENTETPELTVDKPLK